jgi:hypothetical protein
MIHSEKNEFEKFIEEVVIITLKKQKLKRIVFSNRNDKIEDKFTAVIFTSSSYSTAMTSALFRLVRNVSNSANVAKVSILFYAVPSNTYKPATRGR